MALYCVTVTSVTVSNFSCTFLLGGVVALLPRLEGLVGDDVAVVELVEERVQQLCKNQHRVKRLAKFDRIDTSWHCEKETGSTTPQIVNKVTGYKVAL